MKSLEKVKSSKFHRKIQVLYNIKILFLPINENMKKYLEGTDHQSGHNNI